jgi:hypothetical protein
LLVVGQADSKLAVAVVRVDLEQAHPTHYSQLNILF